MKAAFLPHLTLALPACEPKIKDLFEKPVNMRHALPRCVSNLNSLPFVADCGNCTLCEVFP